MEKHTTPLPTWLLAVDIGSHSASGCLCNDHTGEIITMEAPSDPGDPAAPAASVLAGLYQKAGLKPGAAVFIIHGTTLLSGRPLPGGGARTALLVTRGFRDILYTGRSQRPEYYPGYRGPNIPVSRGLTFEVSERMLPGGRVALPLDESQVAELSSTLARMGVESVAVCFLHSGESPAHEINAREILNRVLPGVPVTLSSEILPGSPEYDRALESVISAAGRPLLEGYLERVESILAGCGAKFSGSYVLQSGGSLASARRASHDSSRAALSGPAGGVLACADLARSSGRHDLITLDMGGSGSRISLVHREHPLVASRAGSRERPAVTEMPKIICIPAGAASIARVDGRQDLTIGPGIAGSFPGPACYGRGGSLPTCTDANLVLGRIGPDTLLFGKIRPDAGAALEAVEKYAARPLGSGAEQAALKIIAAVNSLLSAAIMRVSAHRGFDPREFSLVAYGGSGPLHAAEVAYELGIPRVIVPLAPGAHSARGMTLAGLRREYSVLLETDTEKADPDHIDRLFREMETRAREDMARDGVPPGHVRTARSVDMRYAGQRSRMNMQFPAGRLKQADLLLLSRSFRVNHQSVSLFLLEDEATEIVALRLSAAGDLSRGPESPLPAVHRSRDGKQHVPGGHRRVIFRERSPDTPVYQRSDLGPGVSLNGPAVVEQEGATTLLWPGMSATADSLGNLVIDTGVS